MREYTGVWSRRKVIQASGSLAAVTTMKGFAWAEDARVCIVLDPNDALASAPEVRWATDQLEKMFVVRGVQVVRCASLSQANSGVVSVLAASPSYAAVRMLLHNVGLSVPEGSEALGIVHGTIAGKQVVAATGNDARGLVYALLELADRAACATSPISGVMSGRSIVEKPANKVRSMMRSFTSDVEDKPWYNDREMWPEYLTMLAQQRFNRFNLAFGIGYDFIRQVTDAYFLFTYPFLLQVPGYDVRATNLSDSERDANLAMLKYIAKETVARGLEFHVGLWMHGYIWIDSPHANHLIEGITKENHGPYSRDAVRMLLREVPEISGITFRIHGESGVTEGSYDFWKCVFDGVANCGRKVSIDLHTKGMDETMENLALATGQQIQMSPKYWGEHLGLPYHQADIRVMEQPKVGAENATGLMKLSTGTRSFLRYGYGDLLREDRKWSVVHRIWPGTQRLLIWGDPVWASAYSRAFSFCGSDGVEIMEMLSFKGRRGSGIAGNRTAYADSALVPRWDWQKYEYTTRVWGRMLYNPDTESDVFLRQLRKDYGPAGNDVYVALAHASRILPTVLTSYAPSAGNNTYWPELYTNESYVEAKRSGPYADSPIPVVFQTASTFDPPLFARMMECADELLEGKKSGRYSPIEVAQWLEVDSAIANKFWTAAEAKAPNTQTPEHRRMAVDVLLQIGLGEFYAARFRSGVLFAIYERTQDGRALVKSLELYKQSREIWAKLASVAKNVYLPDITVGEQSYQRGHWVDRLPAMDRDIAVVEAKLADVKQRSDAKVTNAIAAALTKQRRRRLVAKHSPQVNFKPGTSLEVKLVTEGADGVRLHYRHVNQAERYTTVAMKRIGDAYSVDIPATYTDTEYPLEYFFEVRQAGGEAEFHPGFDETRTNQPYFVVRKS